MHFDFSPLGLQKFDVLVLSPVTGGNLQQVTGRKRQIL